MHIVQQVPMVDLVELFVGERLNVECRSDSDALTTLQRELGYQRLVKERHRQGHT